MAVRQVKSMEKKLGFDMSSADSGNKKISPSRHRSQSVKSMGQCSEQMGKENLNGLEKNIKQQIHQKINEEIHKQMDQKINQQMHQSLSHTTDFKIVGGIEKIDADGIVHGWVYRVNDLQQRLQVGVYHEHRMVGWALAHLPRNDLPLNMDSQKIGFQIQISPVICDQKPHTLRACVIGNRLMPFAQPFVFQSSVKKKIINQSFLDQKILEKAFFKTAQSIPSGAEQVFLQALFTVCVLMECDCIEAGLQLIDKWPLTFKEHVLSKLKRVEFEMKSQQNEAAAKRLIQMVKEYSDQALVWCLLIDVLVKQGKYEQAQQCFKQLDSLAKFDSDFYKIALVLKVKLYQAMGIEGLSKDQKHILISQCQEVLLIDDENRCASALLFDLNQISNHQQKPIRFSQQQQILQDLIHESTVLNTWFKLFNQT